MNKIMKCSSIVLATAMGISIAPVSLYAKEDLHPTEKAETVYTVLHPDGSVSDIQVSDWLHDEDGIHNIKETLDLQDVENVKGEEKPDIDGKNYTWNAEGNDLYYSGKASKELPIEIHIEYQIDGKKMDAEEAEGKSGHLQMVIQMHNQISREITVNQQKVTVHPSYLGGGMLAFDSDHYKNVHCTSGKILNDGSNEILGFVSVPGLSETLQQMGLDSINKRMHLTDDVVIEADVKDFQPGSIMLGFTNEMSIDELTQYLQMGDLSAGLATLFSASDALESGRKQLQEGITTFCTRVQPLVNAYPQVEQLAAASEQLYDGAQQELQGLSLYAQGVTLLNKGNQKLYGISSGVQLAKENMTSLTAGANQLQAGIEQINGQLQKMDTIDMEALDQMLVQSKQQLSMMEQMLTQDRHIVDGMQMQLQQLQGSIQTLQEAKQAYLSAVEEYNAAVKQNNLVISKDNQVIKEYQDEMSTANKELTNIQNKTNAAINAALKDMQETYDLLTDPQSKVKLQEQINALKTYQLQLQQVSYTQGQLQLLEEIDASKVSGCLDQMTDGLTSIFASLAQAQVNLDTLSADAANAQKALTAMQEALAQMQISSPASISSQFMQLKGAMEQLAQGSVQLTQGCAAYEQGMQSLYEQSLVGIQQVNEASQQLDVRQSALLNGMQQLDLGFSQLAEQKESFLQMSQGLKELKGSLQMLLQGTTQLSSGIQQFNEEGMQQLKDLYHMGTEQWEAFQQVLQTMQELNEENNTYAGAPKGADTTVRYMFKVSEE